MNAIWRLVLITPLLVMPAYAQTNPPPNPPPPAVTPEQARAALDTLKDPQKRAAFTATLEALLKAPTKEPPIQGPPAPVPDPPANPKTTVEGVIIPLAPNSLGAQVLLAASAFVNDASNATVRMFRALESLPLLWAWSIVMLTNPLGQLLLLDAGWRLAVALILSVGLEEVLRYLLRRPMARVLAHGARPAVPDAVPEDPQDRAERGDIEAPPPRQPFGKPRRRIRLGLARFALQILPVLGLVVAGHAVAGTTLGGQSISQLVILAVIDAIAATETLLAVQTLLFMPEPPGLRLFNLSPAVGAYLIRWGRRLILIAVFGYAIGEVGLLLGLSSQAHDALQKATGLAIRICLAIMILQRRRRVRIWLSAPPDADGPMIRMRNRLAKYWAGIALFFMAVSWLNIVFHASDAIARSLWYCAVTAAVVLGATIARIAFSALLRRVRTEDEGGTGLTVRARVSAYRPTIVMAAGLAINALAVLGLSQLYGLGGLTWLLGSDVGHRLVSGLGTITVTIAAAFAIWEGVNIAIQRHLDTLRQDAQLARSARLRTLLPLVRTALAISVAVVAGLMVLSEIGLNIAPLLAGAGIIGVAIGFGSQKLVQDVITGVFLLLENTMQVGDVVKVGDQSGLVESLSVRTIRLRTEDGSVVVIPFSAVTTVINMTRDYSRAVISVNVAYGVDVDRVIEAMRGLVRDMRAEEAWTSIILDDLEMYGIESFEDSGLQIKCRIMCTPFGRWAVGREFNRRIKTCFEELKIEMPYPHMKLVMDVASLTSLGRPASVREAPAPGG